MRSWALAAVHPIDRLPSAPHRQEKAEPAGVVFVKSLPDALVAARREDQRVLIYFTGSSCYWCRKMEQETFTDARFLDCATKFVCVKINIDEEPELAEEYRIYSIPRTIVLDAQKAPVAHRIGFAAAEEYVEFLSAAAAQPPVKWESLFAEMLAAKADGGAEPVEVAPPPVGAAPNDADLLIWFVDQSSERFADGDWAGHHDLLELLQQQGLRPRIEHLLRWELSERWSEAEREATLPDLLAIPTRAGIVRALLEENSLIDVVSQRLTEPMPSAVCRDFRLMNLFAVTESRHTEQVATCVEVLLRPRQEISSAAESILDREEREAAATFAQKAATWWMTGDVESLARHWSSHAPQKKLTRESQEIQSRDNYHDISIPAVRPQWN